MCRPRSARPRDKGPSTIIRLNGANLRDHLEAGISGLADASRPRQPAASDADRELKIARPCRAALKHPGEVTAGGICIALHRKRAAAPKGGDKNSVELALTEVYVPADVESGSNDGEFKHVIPRCRAS